MAPLVNQKNSYLEPLESKRDVTNIVTNVSPPDSPVFTLIKPVSATNRTKESIVDVYNDANKDNAHIEGDEFTNSVLTARSFESNITQIFRKVIDVSATQEAIAKYGGVNSEIREQTKKGFVEIARDVESAYINGVLQTGNGSTTPAKLDGLIAKATTNSVDVSDGSEPGVWEGATEANKLAFEERFNDMLQTGFDTGELFNMVLVGGNRKRRITSLIGNNTRNVEAKEKTLINTIEVYSSDFGQVMVVLDRYVPSTQVLAISRDMIQTAYLRRFTQEKLAKTSDGTRMVIVAQLTLHCLTEKAIGKLNQVV